MSGKLWRPVGYSVAYWFCALFVVGLLQMGDCDGVECYRAKGSLHLISLTVALAVYVVGALIYWRQQRKS